MNDTAAKTRPFHVFRARHLALPMVVVLLALAIAGCGSSSSSSGNGVASKSADEIVAAAKKAASGATSVHVSGSISNEGKQIGINLHLSTGKGATGSLTLQGENINIVETSSFFYLQAGEAFYKQLGGSAAAQLLRGKWLKAPLSSAEFASLAGLTNLSKLLGSTLSAHGTLTKTGTTTINNTAVVGVADTGKQGTLYVATTGTAYPVAIVKTGSSGGKISFDEWNTPVTITTPSPVVDLTQLQGG